MYEGTLVGLASHIVIASLLGMTFILLALFMAARIVTEEDQHEEGFPNVPIQGFFKE